MVTYDTALVLGLGMVGASLAGALRQKAAFKQVIGYDVDDKVVAHAQEKHFITGVTNHLPSAIVEAQLVVLCMPIMSIIDTLPIIAEYATPQTLIVDVGSSKVTITEAMAKLPDYLHCIGGHPMTGKLTTGYDEPHPDLFVNTQFVLTPTDTTHRETAIIEARDIVTKIGAMPLVMDAQQHDELIAYVSHVVPLMPRILVSAVQEADDIYLWQLAAGGFQNATQEAEQELGFWWDVFQTNGTNIANTLRDIAEACEKVASMIESGDVDAITRWDEAVRQDWKKRYDKEDDNT